MSRLKTTESDAKGKMSIKTQLQAASKSLHLVDTDQIVGQGRSAFRAMFELRANPFRSDRDRKCWEIGYKAEQQKWYEQQKRWKDAETAVEFSAPEFSQMMTQPTSTGTK